MKTTAEKLVDQLNAEEAAARLDALQHLKRLLNAGEIEAAVPADECNNHVHTFFSFSPYSPAKAIWMACRAGLQTVGIVDHESTAGIAEFKKAGEIMGIATTVGFEMRVNWDHTPLKGKMLNNPDQTSVSYFPVHGIPLRMLPAIDDFLKPIRSARFERNRRMTEKAGAVLKPYGISIGFEKHVVPLSKWKQGGSITERHILFAIGLRILEKYRKGRELLSFLTEGLQIPETGTMRKYLCDETNPLYEYDLLGVLKGYFSSRMYIPATHAEAPDVTAVVPFLMSIGCIPTYTYLGDIAGESVTGDKKPQKFEDGILDEIFSLLAGYGMKAFSYAPTRNTRRQAERVKALCGKYHMLEICGEDINQPRQPFLCGNPVGRKTFNDTTWAIIGHERLVNEDLLKGFFSEKTEKKYPSLTERIEIYKKAAQKGR